MIKNKTKQTLNARCVWRERNFIVQGQSQSLGMDYNLENISLGRYFSYHVKFSKIRKLYCVAIHWTKNEMLKEFNV